MNKKQQEYKALVKQWQLRILPIIAGLLIATIMGVQFYISYQREQKAVNEMMLYELAIAQNTATFEFYDMVDGISKMQDYVLKNIDNPDIILEKTRDIAKRYPDMASCYIAFAPNFFPQKGYWYEPISYFMNDSLISKNVGSERNNYFEKEWYQGALKAGEEGYWSQSYQDYELNKMICTHSRHLIVGDRLIGVIGLDFTLEWVEDLLENAKPYEDATCLLYSTDGTLLSHSGDMKFDETTHIILSYMLTPVEMRMVLAVPKQQILGNIRRASVIILLILFFAIVLLGYLINRYIRNIREYSRVESEKRLMDNELQIAHTIQMDILRRDFPDDNGVRLDARLKPMREVGGDLYDFYTREDCIFFIIGDVSGKGVPAAMLMSATVNLFRSAVRRLASTKQITEEINDILSNNNPTLTFVTAFVGKLHIPTGIFSFCNAGHLPPIVAGDGKQGVSSLDIMPNIPLGYKEGYNYIEQGTILLKDDTIVLYTDGITEARNESNKMLGKRQWGEIVANNASNIEAMMNAVSRYIGKAEQTDDITLLSIQKKAQPQPYKCTIAAKIESWQKVKYPLMEICMCAGFQKRSIRKIVLAVEEIMVNIINYAYPDNNQGEISLTISAEDQCLTIQIEDSGISFDPTAQPQVDADEVVNKRQIGGLGIMIVKQIMDEIHYERTNDKNILTLKKNNYES